MSLVLTNLKTLNHRAQSSPTAVTIAVGEDASANIAVSRNGTTWVKPSLGLFGATSISAVAWNGLTWVAVGPRGTTSPMYTSTDGYNWVIVTDSTITANTTFSTVAWNGTVWVVGGSSATNKLAYSYNARNWTAVTIAGSVSAVNCLCWVELALPFWLAGTSTNQSMLYSYDGITWVGLGANGPIGTTGTTNAVAWNGLSAAPVILAGMSNGTIYRATTGSNGPGISAWTLSATPFTVCNALCWNGSIWVAGGSGTAILAYSYDGTTWVTVTTPQIATACRAISWNGSVFIAVGTGGVGTNIATSANGIIWSSAITGGSAATRLFSTGGYGIASVALKNPINQDGVFSSGSTVALGLGSSANSNEVALSSNGLVNYRIADRGVREVNCDTQYSEFVRAPLIMMGFNSAAGFGYSLDAVTFASATVNLQAVQTIAWNGAIWLAGGSPIATDTFFWSVNPAGGASAWTLISGIFSTTCREVRWNGIMWVAGGAGTNTLAWSTNGKTWTGLGAILFTQVNSVEWNGSIWVAGGTGSNTFAYSSNGIEWTGLGTLFSAGCTRVRWNGTMFVAALNLTSNNFAYSYDGLNWVQVTTSIFTAANALCWNGSVWAAGGSNGTTNTFASSNDGINWVARGLGPFSATGVVNDISFNGTVFIAAGGSTGPVVRGATSTDAITWSSIAGGVGSTSLPSAVFAGYNAFNGNITDPLLAFERGHGITSAGSNTISIGNDAQVNMTVNPTGVTLFPKRVNTTTAVTIPSAATLRILGPPAAGDNVTITQSYAMDVGTGSTLLRSTTASTSSVTGAVQCAGGAYFGNDSIFGTNLTLSGASGTLTLSGTSSALTLSGASSVLSLANTTASTSSVTGALQCAGGIYAGAGSLFSSLTLSSGAVLSLTNTTASTSSVTGALQCAGGAYFGADCIANTNFRINGRLNAPSQPYLELLSNASTQTATSGALTVYIGWTVNINNGGMSYNSGTGAITVPVSGNYIISGSLRFANTGNTTGERNVRLINGASQILAEQSVPTGETGAQHANVTCFTFLAATATVRIAVFQNSGADLTIATNSTAYRFTCGLITGS